MDEEVEVLCRTIYADTKLFYKAIAARCENLGFQILYGPPFLEAPILFIGYQPGTGLKSPEEEREYGSEDRWPGRCEYATEDWVLAKNMRRMFGTELLEHCVGMNAIFFRSPDIEHFRTHIDHKLRQEMTGFCLHRVTKILEALRPKTVVAIGFETLALFGETTRVLTNEKSGRVLARTGVIAGRQATGTLHLSGAHISKSDRLAIARHILAALD
jgi:hypothetical protein